jgi:hypothetical protein
MQGAHYGTLQPWDRQKVHRSESVGFPRPRLVIETQALLMGFLRKVVELLLQGLPEESSKLSIKWHEIFQNGLESGGEVANWSKYIH